MHFCSSEFSGWSDWMVSQFCYHNIRMSLNDYCGQNNSFLLVFFAHQYKINEQQPHTMHCILCWEQNYFTTVNRNQNHQPSEGSWQHLGMGINPGTYQQSGYCWLWHGGLCDLPRICLLRPSLTHKPSVDTLYVPIITLEHLQLHAL